MVLFWLCRCIEAPILQAGACCAWSFHTAMHTLDHSGVVLSPEDADTVSGYLKCFLLHWQGMLQVCLGAGKRKWRMRPKHHYLEETARWIKETRVNPRRLACWQDESYLGKLKGVALHCHGSAAVLRVFQRLLLNLGRRFRETRDHAEAVLATKRKKRVKTVNVLPLRS